jgi:HSP20 family protein
MTNMAKNVKTTEPEKSTKKKAETKVETGSTSLDAPATLGDMHRAIEHMFDDLRSDWKWPALFRDWSKFDHFSSPSLLSGNRNGFISVKFDVNETDDAIRITAELPGVATDDIDISINEGILSIKGEKKEEREEQNGDRHVTERRYGSFSRSLPMPATIVESKISANCEDGVLTVELPKQAETKSKSKKITVKKK